MKNRNSGLKQSMRAAAMIGGFLLVLGANSAPTARARVPTPQWQETLPAPRFQVDDRRNRVWVLNHDAVYVYDIPERILVKRIELPDWTVAGQGYSCAPGLALAPSGAAFVTSNVLPTIWEIDPQSLVVRQHRLALDADNDKDVGFTSLAYTRDGRQLLGVSSSLGSLWRIDLAAGKAYKVREGSTSPVPCGQ
ncbi:MAG: hypothetical protein HY017_04460 [Betaproteobacteria bacterium]|nr:hypothetical protein [Betaproteobacteria bacterium]